MSGCRPSLQAFGARLALLLLYASSVSGEILTLSGSNFTDIVVDPVRDTFVKFYTPWCGHCKALAPIWKQLDSEVVANPRWRTQVQIAEVDADQNKALTNHYQVKNFPTLLLFSRASHNSDGLATWGRYQGKRELEPLKDFVGEQIKPSKVRRNHAMDLLAQEFYSASATPVKEEIFGRAQRLAQNLGLGGSAAKSTQEALALYIRFMDRAISKGTATFFEDEQERLNKLVYAAGLSDEKVISTLDRLNILEGFLSKTERIQFSSEPAI